MSKFIFEFDGSLCRTSLYLPISGNPVFLFSPNLSGYVTVGDSAYEVTDGRVEIPVSVLPVGEFCAELVTKSKKWRLPRLVYDGKSVFPKPYDDEYIRELSAKLGELEGELRALITEAKKLKERVYGKLELL